jgi:molecular chaperone HscB
MEYFKLFKTPISLRVNKMQVLKTYYALSQEAHPDKHVHSDKSMQQDATTKSAMINEAKKVLDSPDLRLEYILKESGVILPDEKYQLSPLFLAEMMDINEAIMEVKISENEAELNRLKERISTEIENAFEPVKDLFEMEELVLNEPNLKRLKEYYYQHKYLKRIMDSN